MGVFRLFVCLSALAATSYAQFAHRHGVELETLGVFPVSGWRAEKYSAGPGWRAGYEFRALRHVAADVGITESWPLGTTSCNRLGCEYARRALTLLDYGFRGVAPLAAGRVELSIGVGGGYVWHPGGYSGPFGPNQALLQYSGRASIAMDRRGRARLVVSLRTWRDLGRPTQQWLSPAVGVAFGFGRRP